MSCRPGHSDKMTWVYARDQLAAKTREIIRR
jgi:hypothetical protein